MLRRTTLCMVLLAGAFCSIAVSACSDDDSQDDPNAARCEAACLDRPTSGRCAAYDQTTCVDGCVAQLSGLTALCSQCLVEYGYWDGCECSCYGQGCILCCGDECQNPLPTDTCAASEETCTGFTLGSTISDCAAQCTE